jgi:hypothetical protein
MRATMQVVTTFLHEPFEPEAHEKAPAFCRAAWLGGPTR